MQFSEIPGLSELKRQLISSYKQGKVAHAQLFVGHSGTSTFPMALAYASYLMCENKIEEDSCGICTNCVRIKKIIHPDIHFYFPKISATESTYHKVIAKAIPHFREFVAETPFGDIEEWSRKYGQENKNLLISREDSKQMLKHMSMRSVEGGYKILLIWMPELMTPSAINAILKILEEPTQKTLYLLISYSYDNLLATVTSRTQLVNVPPNTEEDIKKYLIQKSIDETKAHNAAKLSEGKIGSGLHIANNMELQEYKDFQKWMQECWNKNLTKLVHRSEDFSKSGKITQKYTLIYTITLLRNAVVHTSGQSPPVQSESEKIFISKFSDKLGFRKIERIYKKVNEAIIHLERNSNPRITHLNLSLDITRMLND